MAHPTPQPSPASSAVNPATPAVDTLWSDLVLRRIAMRVAILLPDDPAGARAVLGYAAQLVDGFLAEAAIGEGTR